MRYDAPMIQCDGNDGYCSSVVPDYYHQTASSVNGIPVTVTSPAPGWLVIDGEDYCPTCLEGRRL